ncbi:hypothetical protein CU100_14690 [Phyllobacterium endophyticum]|uniref:Uncharacterized protein n=1 Tax=Phyllobacterium endophyticum TaxID=1149773 RepID=A0A2P7AQW9_9HYPH|nr:hypothetical protein CU100_14690 [Phyllobacterium endophyticum]
MRLKAVGLPIDHMTINLRMLHPDILGHTIAGAPNEPVEIRDREHGIEVSRGFAESPSRRVMETCKKIIVQLDDPAAPLGCTQIYLRNVASSNTSSSRYAV